ncbi:MAG: AbrB family transcriptional regulator [Chroococcales cyanobacterium]
MFLRVGADSQWSYIPSNLPVNASPVPLTGKALLQKVKELSHLPRGETAKRCGYYTKKENGEIGANLTNFYDAILSAKGVPLDTQKDKNVQGRKPNYQTRVQKNRQIIIGSTYTEAMGLKPGDEFEIILGYKHIHLKKCESK